MWSWIVAGGQGGRPGSRPVRELHKVAKRFMFVRKPAPELSLREDPGSGQGSRPVPVAVGVAVQAECAPVACGSSARGPGSCAVRIPSSRPVVRTKHTSVIGIALAVSACESAVTREIMRRGNNSFVFTCFTRGQ